MIKVKLNGIASIAKVCRTRQGFRLPIKNFHFWPLLSPKFPIGELLDHFSTAFLSSRRDSKGIVKINM